MAISETMSNSAEWMHFYQQNVSGLPQNIQHGYNVSESVTVAAATSAVGSATTTPAAAQSHSNMDVGRSSRPIRKRSRASRRTPITLLNTDTSNFRAMVQQFTGGPSSSFASNPEYSNGTNFGFGLGTQQTMNPSTAMSPSGFQVQFQRQQQPQYQNQQHHIFSSLNSSNNIQGDASASASAFFHKFRPNMEAEVSGGFVNNGGLAHVPPPSGGRGGFLQ